jgi:drug/metabolite transporter (DMT)-like permease
MNIKYKSLIEIHSAVFLFGLSGLFGKLISLPPLIIVLGRVFFSSIFLFFLLCFLKKDIKLKLKRDYLYFIVMGVILAIHWCTFFKSIQVSTVAIALLTYSTFPIFSTFLEPYFFKEKIKLSDIGAAFIALCGVILIIPKFQFGNSLTQGVLWGILSGFTFSILSLFNRKYVKEYSSLVIAFYEQFTATLILIPFLIFGKPVFMFRDIFLLILLGIVFTGISHTLFINGLKTIKAQTSGIISTLEPVYGIIFAAFLLKEMPTFKEILGGIVILISVLYSTIKAKKLTESL